MPLKMLLVIVKGDFCFYNIIEKYRIYLWGYKKVSATEHFCAMANSQTLSCDYIQAKFSIFRGFSEMAYLLKMAVQTLARIDRMDHAADRNPDESC